MKRYTYRVQGRSVIARGPRGGTRFIAQYSDVKKAQQVADYLNKVEESD